MKTVDQTFAYEGLFGLVGRCRIRLYDGPKGKVVIATELDDNPGASITNVAEKVASQACSAFAIPPESLTWVEHYAHGGGQDTFDLVEFDLLPSREGFPLLLGKKDDVLAHPDWSRLTREKVAEMIGEEP